ncbi:MAG: protein kinase [Armatimonadetes bacterium]|nr:protein kinase [Armatimonadota bacterium]
MARRLAEELPDNWLVICNKVFVSPRGEQFEVDCIVVGRQHLFVVDEKSISGEIRGNENEWVLSSGQVRRNPLNKLHYIGARLAGHIREGFPGIHAEAPGRLVTGIVVLSAQDATLHVSDPRTNRQVVKLDAAAETLQAYDSEAKQRGASIAQWRSDIVERLHLLPVRPPTPHSVGPYEILERLDERPHCVVYRARLQRGHESAERILCLYDLSAAATHDPARQMQVMLRDYEALVRLEGIAPVPRVYEPFQFGDRFLAVPREMWRFRSLSSVSSSRALEFEQCLAIAHGLFEGLAKLHGAGVVHRNLSPQALSVELSDGDSVEVGFTDFEFSRLQGEQTIVPDLSDATGLTTPYEAPEVRADLSAASPESDLFSAAVIALQLLTGLDPKSLVSVCMSDAPDAVISQGIPAAHESARELLELLVLLVGADAPDRSDLQPEIMRALRACNPNRAAGATGGDTPGGAPTVFSAGDIIAGQYKVTQVFPPGATAVTYLVTDELYGGEFVLKQIVRDDCRQRLAGTEFRALQGLQHPAIVKVHDVRRPDDEFHLKLEYVRGPSLEELADGFPWSLDRTHELACTLLDACAYLTDQGLIHRDISPRNIIVPDADTVPAKLIDFGVSRTEHASGCTMVGTPRYRAPEIDRGQQWDASCDVYATSVVLFRVLTGTFPFSLTDTTADKYQMVDVTALGLSETALEYARVLQQGCDPDKSQRVGSAESLLDRLNAVIRTRPVELDGRWVESDLVAALQAIYRNSRTGNADNRGLDTAFAEATYVPTLLDTRLVPDIMAGRFLLVLLTGNPGDGKTAFLEHVRRRLAEAGAHFHSSDPNGWRALYEGREYAANYDASEAHEGKRADAILDEMLAPLSGAAPHTSSREFTGLIAINDGRLRDYFLRNDRYRWLGEVIYRKLREPGADRDPAVALVDLKSRCLTATSATGVTLLERVLTAIVEHEGWDACSGCRARASCTIRLNRDSLADPTHGPVVRARLCRLFHLTHLRGTRHTTIRDLRSALSYVVAGVRSCREIHEEVASGQQREGWYNALYFNAVFNPEGELDDELTDLTQYDVGRYPAPRWDRFLHYNRSRQKQGVIDEMLLSGFDRSSSPLAGISHAALQSAWYQAVKRRLYFEADQTRLSNCDWRPPFPEDLLPYRHARVFDDVVAGKLPLDEVRDRLCGAISASDGIVDPKTQADHLCVRTAHSEAQEFTVFKRHPAHDFVCRVASPADERFIESCPNTIEFSHVDGDPKLRIHLDLFELLMRMQEGYMPDVLEWQPFMVDLDQFKTRLKRLKSDEVILMESGRVLHRVHVQDGALVRSPAAPEGEAIP